MRARAQRDVAPTSGPRVWVRIPGSPEGGAPTASPQWHMLYPGWGLRNHPIGWSDEPASGSD